MRIVCISDTHGLHARLGVPNCDMLIHSGDFTSSGKLAEVVEFLRWFSIQPAKHRILIAGNHDDFAERCAAEFGRMLRHYDVHYLSDSGVTLDGLSVWGSPITPQFFDWAFTRERGHAIRKHWEMIPVGTDVLVTHGPPQGVGDMTARGEAAGCADLLQRVKFIAPKIHVFGHIHDGRGEYRLHGLRTRFVNASSVSRYLHPPVVIDLADSAQQ